MARLVVGLGFCNIVTLVGLGFESEGPQWNLSRDQFGHNMMARVPPLFFSFTFCPLTPKILLSSRFLPALPGSQQSSLPTDQKGLSGRQAFLHTSRVDSTTLRGNLGLGARPCRSTHDSMIAFPNDIAKRQISDK